VNLPASVTSIGSFVFTSCVNLASITVDPSNPDYSSVGGVLFDKNVQTLIQYPAGNIGGSYIIPGSVTSLAMGAFYDCANLAKVTIPSSVTFIPEEAFYDCTRLVTVNIPNGVTGIAEEAFSYCTSLTSMIIPARETLINAGGDAERGNW
jgi:hypothetical protein